MKKKLQISIIVLFALFFTAAITFGQTSPTVGTVPDDSLIVNSGGGYVLIPNINDEDGMTQAITFTVTSTDNGICQPGTVDYTTGNTVAVLNLIEKGVIGTVTISVTIDDGDATAQSTFSLYVGSYNKPGLKFEIHDIVFWQESIPLTGIPIYSDISPTGEQPYSAITDWNLIPLTVSAGCSSGYCDGHDFSTTIQRGYLVPTVSADYTFYYNNDADHGLFLSTDDDFANATAIAIKSDNHGIVGTVSGSDVISAPQSLVAGKVYAIYSVGWNVHGNFGGILWESFGAGISKQYIPGANLMWVYDPIVPTAPSNLTLTTKGSNMLRISWTAGTDDKSVAGYYVYLDGIRVNSTPTTDTNFKLSSLTGNTTYSVVVTTVDGMGNESVPSNILTTKTWSTDAINPTPPTLISTTTNTGTALEIAWSGATDGETEVIAYNVYVDGVLYNTADYIYETSTIIKVLDPRTSYDITIEAIDAALNVSAISSTYPETTASFDPYGSSLGVKRAVINVTMENAAFSAGIGVNPTWENGTAINDAAQINLMKDLKVGAIRWGGIGANSVSHNFTNHIGTGKSLTYGDWIQAAIDLDAYAVIVCAVEDGSDFRNYVATFSHFIEYVNGPSGTTYGDMRISEGYTDPMLQHVKGLIFEFGNEVWGGDNHLAQIGNNYDTYATWCRQAADVMKTSPYYDSTKINLVYSGRGPTAGQPQNTKVIKGDDGKVDWLAISGYLGGNLNYEPEIAAGESEMDYYKNGIELMGNNLIGIEGLLKYSLEERGKPMPMYFYEGNTTTPAYNARLGQGIMTLDYFASSIERGHAVPSIFHLTGGQWRITDPGNSYEPYCLYYTTKFFNKVAKDRNVLKTTVLSPDVLTNSIGTELPLDPVSAHAYTINGNYGVVLISRDYEEDYYVQLDLPNTLTYSATATQYTITGTDISAFATSVDSSTISLTDSILIKVPKHGMIVLSFTGDDQNFTSMQPGEYSYVHQSSISINLTGGTSITDDGAFLLMDATTLPANSFITAVKWEITDNTINLISANNGEGYLIQASGECTGNGSVTIRASLLDDPSIYDEVIIPVSGQVSSGGCSGSSIEENTAEFSVFPNPAKDILNITISSNERAIATILNVQGSVINKLEVSGSQEINISSLNSGVYLIQLSTTSGFYTQKFIKE